MSLGQQVATSLKHTALFRFSGQLLTWIATLFIIRLLSPSDYGLVAMAMFPIALLLFVVDLGLSASVVRAAEIDPEEIAQVMGAIRIMGLAIFAGILLLAPVCAWASGEPRLATVLRALAVGIVIQSWTALPEALMRRAMRFGELSQIEFWGGLVGVIFALALAFAGAEVWALIGGIIIPGMIKLVAVTYTVNLQVKPVYSISRLTQHLRYGRDAAGSGFIWTCWSASDAAIVGSVIGTVGAGIYAIGKQVSALPSEKLMPLLNQVLFRAFASIQNDAQRVAGQGQRVMRLLFVIAVPLGWGLASVAPEFVAVVLGAKWIEAVPLVRAFCLTTPLGMLGSMSSVLAQSLGRADIALRGSLTMLAIIPVAIFIGARTGGLDGIVMTWLVVYPLVVLVNLRRDLAVAGVSLASVLAELWPATLAGLAMLAAVWGAGELIGHDIPKWSRLMLLVAAGAATYLPLVYLLDRTSMFDLYRLVRTKSL